MQMSKQTSKNENKNNQNKGNQNKNNLNKNNQNKDNQNNKLLYQAILSLQNIEECIQFFQDLCTPTEIQAMKDRFVVATLLDQKKLSYREIHDKTGISLVTIGRVARFLAHEKNHGYRLTLDRLKNQKAHEEDA